MCLNTTRTCLGKLARHTRRPNSQNDQAECKLQDKKKRAKEDQDKRKAPSKVTVGSVTVAVAAGKPTELQSKELKLSANALMKVASTVDATGK